MRDWSQGEKPPGAESFLNLHNPRTWPISVCFLQNRNIAGRFLREARTSLPPGFANALAVIVLVSAAD